MKKDFVNYGYLPDLEEDLIEIFKIQIGFEKIELVIVFDGTQDLAGLASCFRDKNSAESRSRLCTNFEPGEFCVFLDY